MYLLEITHELNKLWDSGYVQKCSSTNHPKYFSLTNVVPTVGHLTRQGNNAVGSHPFLKHSLNQI